MFEHTELFARSVGESSDIVNKEMYTFMDKGNRSITLRPEGTAGAIRAFVTNKLYSSPDMPVKLMYDGSVFRYERPQAGRFRQFRQFGFEEIGARSPYVDVELIMMIKAILETLGFEGLKIKINTIGDSESRNNYSKVLREHFASHLDTMCPDCRRRLETNPLRILDCKVDAEHEAIKNAPKIKDYLTDASKEYFAKTLELLDSLDVKYEIDESLVRGLDYYNDVVFEIHQIDNKYGALGAGGRYDSLVKEVGGPDLPAVGMAFGVDRLVMIMEEEGMFEDENDINVDVFVMPMKDGEIVTEPYIGKVASASDLSSIDIDDEDLKKAVIAAAGEKKVIAVITQQDDTNVEGDQSYSPTIDPKDFSDGVVMVDYYTEYESGAQQIDITPDKFGGNYYLEASTLFRTTDGVDMPAEFIIPNCKIQSNFTFTMASSGDPSTFTFTMDAFPDYTRFNKTKKVLAAI
jgi:histidyl-tRNA synthetase